MFGILIAAGVIVAVILLWKVIVAIFQIIFGFIGLFI